MRGSSADLDQGGVGQELVGRHLQVARRRSEADAPGGIVVRPVAGAEPAAVVAPAVAQRLALGDAAEVRADLPITRPSSPCGARKKQSVRRLKLSGCAIPNTVQRLKSRKDLIMNKNPLFTERPSPGSRFRNLHFASWNSFSAAMVFLLVIALSPCLAVQNCTLAWEASSGATGYRLRYGTRRRKSRPVERRRPPSTTWTISNLNDATTYYFTVAAYNAAGREPTLESDFLHDACCAAFRHPRQRR